MVQQQIEIPGYEGCYAVTMDGFVKNLRTGKILIPFPSRQKGACVVTLSKNNVQKQYTMSKLMRMTYFVGETRPLWHKNRDSSDFRIQNIQPMDRGEYGRKFICSHPHGVVRFLYMPDKEVKFYRSTGEAARDVGVHKSSIQNWCKKRFTTNKTKYTYMYESDYYSLMQSLSQKKDGVMSYKPPEPKEMHKSILTPSQWQWARDKWLQGYTLVEIGKVLGVNASTIRAGFERYGYKKPTLPPLRKKDVPKE